MCKTWENLSLFQLYKPWFFEIFSSSIIPRQKFLIHFWTFTSISRELQERIQGSLEEITLGRRRISRVTRNSFPADLAHRLGKQPRHLAGLSCIMHLRPRNNLFPCIRDFLCVHRIPNSRRFAGNWKSWLLYIKPSRRMWTGVDEEKYFIGNWKTLQTRKRTRDSDFTALFLSWFLYTQCSLRPLEKICFFISFFFYHF